MASINTNVAAMTALQTLTATNKNLSTTQDRIATGMRVGQASDNAAYWSIATTMRSDNRSMSSVQDALGFGAAQVDVAYTAMDAVKDTLDNMKAKIVAASQPDIDKAKIQEEIKQLQNDLRTYAESASFSGGNWLNVADTDTQKVVASFMRDADNNISLGTIDIDTSKTALFTGNDEGILQAGLKVEKDLGDADVGDTPVTGDAGATTEASHTITDFPASWAIGDTFSFDISLNGGEAVTVTMTATEENFGANDADKETAFNDALAAAGVTGVTADVTSGTVTIERDAAVDGDTVVISNLSGTTTDENLNATNFDITEASQQQLSYYLSDIDSMLMEVTTAASDLGAIKTRIDSQQTFVSKIMDAIDRGVGQLVDADMQEESARLSALQVQQQLGIQALSIANSNAQNILSLFR